MTHPNGNDTLVITASGDDKVGLVEQFTSRITEAGGNIEESRMAVLGGQFAIIMHVTGLWNALAKLEIELEPLGQALGLGVTYRRTHGRQRKSAVVPYQIDVVSLDHPGIVHRLSHFFSERDINIEELQTDTYPAPHTGAPMFSVAMTVAVPATVTSPRCAATFSSIAMT